MLSRRLFQAILAVIALVAITTGLLGVVVGLTDSFYLNASDRTQGLVVLDSNLRYFSGVWLGLGFVIIWMIPSIERQKTVFRLAAGMIFLGAVGRVFSILSFGVPSLPFVMFTLLELLFPLLIFWQNALSHSAAELSLHAQT